MSYQQQTDVPMALKTIRHKANQVEANTLPRKSEFIRPVAVQEVNAVGGTVSFRVDQPETLLSFRDSSILLKFKSAANASTGPSGVFNILDTIKTITVTDQSNAVFHLSNAAIVNMLLRNFRGTEEESVDASNSYTRGNALLVTTPPITSTVSATYSMEIPLSRFGDFFMNDQYYNKSITDIKIEFGPLASGHATAGTTIGDDKLDSFQFAYVNYNLDKTLMDEKIRKIKKEDSAINMKWYTAQPMKLNSGVGILPIAHRTSSLDKIGGIATGATTSKPTPITSIDSLDVYVNGRTLKQTSVSTIEQAAHMTLESANVISNQFLGMVRDFYVNYAHTADGSKKLGCFLFSTAFEDEYGLKTGINTVTQDRAAVHFTGAPTDATVWVVTENTGTLYTGSNGNTWVA